MTKPRTSLNSMRMQANGRGEILIYDEIGYGWFEEGVTAKGFLQQLKDLGDVSAIDVRINSPGGSVVHGLAIYNALAKHPAQIEIHIDGLAASMATVVAMAGDKINMAQNALFMIHNPAALIFGDAEALRSEAKLLDTMGQNAIDIYAARSKGDPEAIRAAMAAETWYSAADAKTAGFVDEVTPNKTLTASGSVDERLTKKAPAWAKSRLAAMRATVAKGAVMAVTRTDLTVVSETEESTSGDIQNAEGTVVGTWSLASTEDEPADEPSLEDDDEEEVAEDDEEEQPTARKGKAKAKAKATKAVSAAVARAEGVKAERERITTITALCHKAKQPQMAAALCEDPDVTVADARRQLFDAMCKANKPVGDAGGTPSKPKTNADGNEKYRQEYKDEPGYAAQMSEAEYIEMRRIDDGKTVLKAGSASNK